MTAPVERRHRELAYKAVEGCDYSGASSDGRNWIDGQLTIGEYGLELAIAQALADIEAPLLAEVERLKSGAPARIAHVLDDTRGFHVESLDEDTRADFLHRITNAAFDGEAPSSWHAVPPEQK